MKEKVMYTQEQLDIALLKNSQDGMLRELSRVGQEVHTMHSEIKTQSHWNIGLILGIYGIMGGAALGKVFGVL